VDLPSERLRQYPFLAVLSETVLKKVQPHLCEKRFASGELLLRLGDYSDAAYYLAEGTVEVRVPDAAAAAAADARLASPRLPRPVVPVPPRPTLTFQSVMLGPGDIFGEIGALSRYPVTADVVASTDVLVLMIATPGLRLLLKQRELASFRQSIDDRYRARTLASHLRRVELLAGVDDETIARLRDAAELLAFDPGAVIARAGTAVDGLYLVRGGHVRISAGADGRTVSYLRKGDHAGENGLLDNAPWPYSLTAIEHVEIVRLPAGICRDVLAAWPSVATRLRDDARTRDDLVARTSSDAAATRFMEIAVDKGLINGQSVLLIDLQRCTGCDDCVTACADTHGGVPRFVRDGARYGRWAVPTACFQCSDPVCMIGCPTGAITRPLGGIEVTIDPATCIGCGNCVRRCPWGNIVTVTADSPAAGRSIELPTKQMCPHGAMTRVSFHDPAAVAAALGDAGEGRR